MLAAAESLGIVVWESSLIPEECSNLSAHTGRAGPLRTIESVIIPHHSCSMLGSQHLMVLVIMDL